MKSHGDDCSVRGGDLPLKTKTGQQTAASCLYVQYGAYFLYVQYGAYFLCVQYGAYFLVLKMQVVLCAENLFTVI